MESEGGGDESWQHYWESVSDGWRRWWPARIGHQRVEEREDDMNLSPTGGAGELLGSAAENKKILTTKH
jgi:hypothetical protein